MKLIVLLLSMVLRTCLIAQTNVTASGRTNCFQSVTQDVVIVGDVKGFDVSADTFKRQNGLTVNLPKIAETKFIIVSYEYMRARDGQIAFSANVEGANFSEEVSNDITKVRSGDVIFFDAIKLMDSTGNKFTLPTVKYKLL
ncbi:hypothetical protein BH09BAC1_BH09BAC1_20270 [soil metagenome]